MVVDHVWAGQLAAGEALKFPVRRRRWGVRLVGFLVAALVFIGLLASSGRFDGGQRTYFLVVAVLALAASALQAVWAAVQLATLRPVQIDSAGVRSGDRLVEWRDIQSIASRPASVWRGLGRSDADVKVISSQGGYVVITRDHIDDVADLADLLNAEAAKRRRAA
ncbi:hypothetical protein ACIA49_18810 [Kribbella sp. NPDC051587]|uniref:hypothetical protein n=1 Tax=Kribbella sp. NPDC051587 TaxID=3364119 RepID=UPI00378E6977